MILPKNFPFVVHTSRNDSRLRVDSPSVLLRFMEKRWGECPQRVVWMGQEHGTRVQNITGGSSRRISHTDGVLTALSGTALVVQTADCVPVVLYDPVHRVIGVVHAGWRGVLRGIVPKALRKMQLHFGSIPSQLQVYLGPSIRVCCYRCDPARRAQFVRAFGKVSVRRTETIDLINALVVDLRKRGIPSTSLRVHPSCTACRGHRRYFSYRRGDSENFLTLVMLPSTFERSCAPVQ